MTITCYLWACIALSILGMIIPISESEAVVHDHCKYEYVLPDQMMSPYSCIMCYRVYCGPCIEKLCGIQELEKVSYTTVSRLPPNF